MRKKINIGIGSLEAAGRRFVDVWHAVEQGQPVARREVLTFDDLNTLLRVLSSTRWTLLRTLRREGPMSVRALAKMLVRDYKNVHRDVRTLESVGLISRNQQKLVVVPWDTVVTEVRLDAA